MEMVIYMEMKEMRKEIYDVDTELTFGKHKNFTIRDIYNMDYQYLIWMYENFDNVDWTDEALKLVTEAIDIMSCERKQNHTYNGGGYFSQVNGFHGDEGIFGNSPHDFFK